MRRLSILLELAKLGAHSEPCQITSKELGEKIGCSQQTAARWLKKLSEGGLIDQDVGPRGQTILLTSRGINALQSIWQDLDKIFGEPPKKPKLIGRVVSGLGEGSYYMGQEKYRGQFKEKLGFNPYLGTLDLELSGRSLRLKERLQGSRGIEIEGFSTPERSFGGAKCFPARVKGINAGVVLPNRTPHEEVIEVIAPEKLRDKLDLEDGDEVSVEVEI